MLTREDEARVEAVVSRTLRVPLERLSQETRRGRLEEWDSLAHLVLVEALGRELGISIPPEDALEMETLADVKRVVARRMESARSR